MGACVPPGENAVKSLVDSVLADNAEANDDRAAHGERDYEPLWPLPNRRREAASQAAPAAAVGLDWRTVTWQASPATR